MAVRFTTSGLLSIEYDPKSRKWHSRLRPPQLRDWMRTTELEPGLSMGDVFEVLATNAELMRAISEICYVDAAALHDRPRLCTEPLQRSDFIKVVKLPDTPVTEVVLERRLHLTDDSSDGTPDFGDTAYSPRQANRFKWTSFGIAVNGPEWRSPLSVASALDDPVPVSENMQRLSPFVELLSFDHVFSGLVHLPLRLRSLVEENEVEQENQLPFRLWEILVAIYGSFGKLPSYLETSPTGIDRSEEAMDTLRSVFDAEPDPDEDSNPDAT